MKYLEKYLDYLPLFPVLGILLSLPGGAIRLPNIYYLIIGLVTFPVWILLITAALKIRKSEKQKTSLIFPSVTGGKRGENEGREK